MLLCIVFVIVEGTHVEQVRVQGEESVEEAGISAARKRSGYDLML
jgi:hypothetical protein